MQKVKGMSDCVIHSLDGLLREETAQMLISYYMKLNTYNRIHRRSRSSFKQNKRNSRGKTKR